MRFTGFERLHFIEFEPWNKICASVRQPLFRRAPDEARPCASMRCKRAELVTVTKERGGNKNGPRH